MDINVLLTLLTLSEKLQGHPRLSGMKTLVDEQINKMHIDSEKDVQKLAEDKKAAQAKIDADAANKVAVETGAAAEPAPAKEHFWDRAAAKPAEPDANIDRRI